MLLRFPFLEGISCPPAARGLLGPWTGTAALETEGLLCMCMLCSKHLKYSAISSWEHSICASRVAWRNLRASQGKRPHWKPWRTLRAQGAKEGTISPVASKRSKAIPWAAARFGRRQKRVNHSQESWGLTYYLGSVDGRQDKESGGTPVMLSCCAALPRRWELGSVPSYYIYGTAQAIVSVFSYMQWGCMFLIFNSAVEPSKGVGREAQVPALWMFAVHDLLVLTVQRLGQTFNKNNMKRRRQRYKSALKKWKLNFGLR